MISSAFKKLFGVRGEKKVEVADSQVKDLADEEEIPRYPPFAKGLPMSPVDKVLQTQNELIQKIRGTLGFTQEEYDRLVMPVIVRYASFVHLLPASEAHHHRGAGGLFRHGLEVAFWATQASESVIFSISGSPRERRNNEPRWRLACCFSGLLHDVGKPLSDVVVTNRDGSKTWNPYSETLVDWAKRHSVSRYFLRWRDREHKRHEQFSLLTVERILTPEALEFLSAPGKDIIESMLQAISGLRINDPVTKLMLKADGESVSRDLKQNRLDVDEFAYGVPVERYVFDALRRLVKTGKWKVNEPGAKVWHLHQGVFITWKQGVSDIYDLLMEDKIPGIPRDPDTLADILIERGFALKNVLPEQGKDVFYRYWEVIPELPQEGEITGITGKIKMQMLRLDSPELIFTTEPPAAIEGKIITVSSEQEPEPPAHSSEQEPEPPAQEVSQTATPLTLDDPLNDGALGVCDFPFDAFELNTEPDTTQPDTTQKDKKDKKDKAEPPNAPTEQSKKEDILSEQSKQSKQSKKEDTLLPGIDNIRSGKKPNKKPNIAAPLSPNEFFGPEPSAIKDRDREELNAETYSSSQQDNQQDKSSDTDVRGHLENVLSGYGAAESILKEAIVPVLDGRRTLGEVLCFMKKKAVILYPEGARELGAPTEVLNTLFNAGAIEPDPVHPNRKVHDFGGIKGLLLSSEISNVVKAAIEQTKKDFDPDREVSALTLNGKRQSGKKTKTTGNKPPKETQPMILDFDSDLELPMTKMAGQMYPEDKELKKPQNAKEIIDDKDFLPPQPDINAEEAIRLLKEMIKNKKGRWLVGPVIKEDGCLVTSDKALDKVTGECTNLSKSMLRALLTSGQRRPRMTIRQGNLRLEVE